MRVLIFGATGFLGRKLVDILIKQRKIIFFKALRNKKRIKEKNSIFCDLKNTESIKDVLCRISPSVVINLAAEVSFKKKTDEMFLVNSIAPKIIANYCSLNGIHYIHASTASVHGLHNKFFGKKISCNPDTEYGKSKLVGDSNIMRSNCFYSILRFPGIYGFSGPKHLGINLSIKNALNAKKPMLYGDGLAKRNYIFVDDAARIILKLIKKKRKGIFYIGGETVTFKQMFRDIYDFWFPSEKIITRKLRNKTHDQLIIIDKDFSFYTSFRNSLKEINKKKLKHVQ